MCGGKCSHINLILLSLASGCLTGLTDGFCVPTIVFVLQWHTQAGTSDGTYSSRSVDFTWCDEFYSAHICLSNTKVILAWLAHLVLSKWAVSREHQCCSMFSRNMNLCWLEAGAYLWNVRSSWLSRGTTVQGRCGVLGWSERRQHTRCCFPSPSWRRLQVTCPRLSVKRKVACSESLG